MAVAEAHPSVEELAAFTLGTLGEGTQASIEAHVATCASCQERAAVAPGDTLVELLRRVHARTGCEAKTFAEASAQVQTPVPLSAVAGTDAFMPAVALSVSAESDGSEVPDALPPELARHERYRIVRLLGVGGMGAVYQAEHRVLHRFVALKVIKRAYTANAAALERFRREVRAAARLSHPNIVATHDAEDAGETHFLVMEYVEGTDLGRLVQEDGPLPVDRACEYVRQAALGLQYAFEQGMVHRDLKPHNLMLTPDGRVKILDFGLAHFASEAASAAGLTGTGVVLGTVDYIAPEQADNAHQADIRSDIYSLGCTLHHLLAGQPPFPTGTPLQKVMAHVNRKPQPLTELRDDLPEGLMPVLERMMAKDPKHRYQTPTEVAFALEPFTIATAVTRAPKSRPVARMTDDDRTVLLEKTSVRGRWRRRFMIATAIMVFLVAGLLGTAVYRIATDKGEFVVEVDDPQVEVRLTQQRLTVKDKKTKREYDIKPGRHDLRTGEYEIDVSEASSGLVFSAREFSIKRGGKQTVKVSLHWMEKDKKVPVGEVRRFEGYRSDVWCVAFSPDGRHALCHSHNLIHFWDVATGHEIHQMKGHTDAIGSVVFTPDGHHAVSCSIDRTIRVWDLKTGKELRRFKDHGSGISDLAISSDSRWIVSSTGDHVVLWDYATGEKVRPFEGQYPAARRVAFSPDGRQVLSGHSDGMHLWDVKTGKELHLFKVDSDGVPCVAFSPDGRRAISGSCDNRIILWDIATRKQLRQFPGHNGIVEVVTFSPDGRRILSGGWDATLRLWEVDKDKEICRFDHDVGGKVLGVAFSPDGRYALSSSQDKTARLWRLPDPPPAKKNP